MIFFIGTYKDTFKKNEKMNAVLTKRLQSLPVCVFPACFIQNMESVFKFIYDYMDIYMKGKEFNEDILFKGNRGKHFRIITIIDFDTMPHVYMIVYCFE